MYKLKLTRHTHVSAFPWHLIHQQGDGSAEGANRGAAPPPFVTIEGLRFHDNGPTVAWVQQFCLEWSSTVAGLAGRCAEQEEVGH